MAAAELDRDQPNAHDTKEHGRQSNQSVLRLVKAIVFIDFLGVAVVVPLLSSYFRDLGTSTELYGLVSSLYFAAQIAGGLVLGGLSDRLGRRSMLLLSFIGSTISYGLVSVPSLWVLLVSRVVVGVVKQTMTVCTALISDHTDKSNRAKELSHLSAASTFSFIVGPSLGSLLYQRHRLLPPLVSASLFLLNSLLALLFLSNNSKPHLKAQEEDGLKGKTTGSRTFKSIVNNLKFSCNSAACAQIVVAKLLYGFALRAISPSLFVGYYEERFQVDSHILGYIHSYKGGLGLIMQVYVVGKLTDKVSESHLVTTALAMMSLAYFLESGNITLGVFLTGIVPVGVLAHALLDVCLKSLFTQRMPQKDIGAALGSLNVLQSAVGVVAPLYGGELYGHLSLAQRPLVASVHYAAFVLMWIFAEGFRPFRMVPLAKAKADLPNTQTFPDGGVTEQSMQCDSVTQGSPTVTAKKLA